MIIYTIDIVGLLFVGLILIGFAFYGLCIWIDIIVTKFKEFRFERKLRKLERRNGK